MCGGLEPRSDSWFVQNLGRTKKILLRRHDGLLDGPIRKCITVCISVGLTAVSPLMVALFASLLVHHRLQSVLFLKWCPILYSRVSGLPGCWSFVCYLSLRTYVDCWIVQSPLAFLFRALIAICSMVGCSLLLCSVYVSQFTLSLCLHLVRWLFDCLCLRFL